MSDTNTSDAAGSKVDGFYPLTGTVTNLTFRTSVTGTRFFTASFATTLRKKPAQIGLTGFGKTIDNLGDELVEGGRISVRGRFGEGKYARSFRCVDKVRTKAA